MYRNAIIVVLCMVFNINLAAAEERSGQLLHSSTTFYKELWNSQKDESDTPQAPTVQQPVKKAPVKNNVQNKSATKNPVPTVTTPDGTFTPKPVKESNVLELVAGINSNCSGHWKGNTCMASVSRVAHNLTRDYAKKLDANGKKSSLEPLRQHCAASTAALQIEVPEYAILSAATECANIISDINGQTQTPPDLNMYQLLIGAIMCMNKDTTCAGIEKSLAALK